MTTNRFSGLFYQQDDAPVDPFALAKGLMTAQATLKPKIYWDQRLKMNDFENEDPLRRTNEQINPQPQGQRPQGQVGQTSISDVQFQAYVNRLQAPPYNMPPDRARAAAMEQLKLQGLMR